MQSKKPHRRTPDEMLRDAVSDECYAALPGKGKPLNLRDYFSADTEFRMAGKILRDNQVLPPQLQERKDAELRLNEAKAQLQKATESILPLRSEIYRAAQHVINVFSDRETVCETLGLDNLPDDFPEPQETIEISVKELNVRVAELDKQIKRYNAQVRNLTYRYLENLRIAHENIEASKKRQLLNQSLLPAYAPLPKLDLDALTNEFNTRFTSLPELAHDWENRLKIWHRTQNPTFWQRLFSSL